MMQPFTPTKQIVYGAMAAALSALCLLLAGTLPVMRAALLFISSLFVYVLTERGHYIAGVASFLAAAAIALLVIPNKLICAPFIGLFGHYGIFMPWLRRKLTSRNLFYLLTGLYCAACTAIAYFACTSLLGVDIPSLMPFSPLWLIPVLVAAIAAFIVLYGLCCRFYTARLSHLIH